MPPPAITGVVLAGGRSSRFGRDKALLEFKGQTLLERTVAAVRSATADVVVIGPPERARQVADVQILADEIAGIGPLGGIYTALRARPGAGVLVVAVDMPFLNAELLRFLVGLREEADVVLPVVGGRGQQLHAVYGSACLSPISAQISAGDYKIDRFFPLLSVRRVTEAEIQVFDPGFDSFRNVNTPELWVAALADAQQQ